MTACVLAGLVGCGSKEAAAPESAAPVQEALVETVAVAESAGSDSDYSFKEASRAIEIFDLDKDRPDTALGLGQLYMGKFDLTYDELVSQLEFEGYTTKEAKEAADQIFEK